MLVEKLISKYSVKILVEKSVIDHMKSKGLDKGEYYMRKCELYSEYQDFVYNLKRILNEAIFSEDKECDICGKVKRTYPICIKY